MIPNWIRKQNPDPQLWLKLRLGNISQEMLTLSLTTPHCVHLVSAPIFNQFATKARYTAQDGEYGLFYARAAVSHSLFYPL